MNKNQRKNFDDFLNGTFTSGGIFDEPARVKFKEPQKPPPKITISKKEKLKEQLDPAIAAKLKKFEAIANDERAPEPERQAARQMIEKFKNRNF